MNSAAAPRTSSSSRLLRVVGLALLIVGLLAGFAVYSLTRSPMAISIAALFLVLGTVVLAVSYLSRDRAKQPVTGQEH